MKLTTQQAYALLEKHGSYITEICDACGQGIGPVRYTRRGDSGVWCSRECRDGKEARQPGTCQHCRASLPERKRRGAAFCDDACRQAARRSKPTVQTAKPRELSVTKPTIYAAFSSEKTLVHGASHPGAVSRAPGELQR
jgi:hypothetical protein